MIFLLSPAQLIAAPSPDNETIQINGEELPRDINLIKPLVLSSLCEYINFQYPSIKPYLITHLSIQIIGKRNSDNKLIDFAKLLEKELALQYDNPLV